MRVLLVEDEAGIAEFVQRGLQEYHYHVTVAPDGETGLRLALEQRFGVIILDIMLPRRDGWSVCRELRERRVTTPILMLTARDAVRDRVRGLETGADDYLCKPFDFSELLARVQALTRRDRIHKGRLIRVADLEVDTTARTVARAGRRMDLTAREYELLEALAAHEGQILSREVIQERVWMDDESYSNTVDVHIKGLRKKIDADFPVKLIHTVYGQGYVLEVRDPAPKAEPPPASDSRDASR
ncbi:MAG TPA: response regulator transcription factor [Armatimonadetes bacterium]|jgi:DNA-binding response OmpR family regulator|nr:response regulator transcription factor [Armatimonadota bacterium]